ncbi:MAG: AAA family ATPase [Dysgonomonas sp.]|jgi:energy-coupling factor transporter ATP-binding protein EcfA2|uniref:AAA family ATPase n=1 Tax=Dysgonomonas sp. TaxID=1891233 RepID=UPI002834D0D5|nr:ATP-binding protein [Prevotella sp.]
MILSALKYTRYVGEPREWSIVGNGGDYAYFNNINLLVGKNASGKSRTLNVIREIADLLSGRIDLKYAISPSELFELIFTNGNNDKYKYSLTFKDRIVTDEVLSLNDKVLLNRSERILLNSQGEKIPFEVAGFEIVISQCDAEGKPYFANLVSWGESLKNYLFANQLEKNRLVKDYTQIDGDDHDIDDPDVLIYTFYKGRELFGETFISEVKAGMQELGYSITNIDIKETRGGFGIFIEEDGEYTISQREMSQGMFRALSLFIMLSYARLSDISLCLLIDDMGEGLDFESSKKMMDLVIKKVNKSSMQFFMTSNDRQVMNQIPLRYWSVIGRESSRSIFYDYTNSKDTFDDFKYTGLNNFDFLATDFFKKGFGVIDEDND